MLRLRVKTREGGQVPLTERVRGDSTLEDLSAAIHDVTAIPPHRQKILIGECQNDFVIILPKTRMFFLLAHNDST